MSIVKNKTKYKKRIVDSLIERDLKIFGAFCIEGPKRCGKTWTSSPHSNSEFLVGDSRSNFSNHLFLEGEHCTVIKRWNSKINRWMSGSSKSLECTKVYVDSKVEEGEMV